MASLIAIVDDEGAKIVQFSHFSVKEFLTSDRLESSDVGNICEYYIPLGPAHTILARACLTVLLQADKRRVEATPLALYAAQNWVMHAEFEDVASKIQGPMECLFNPKEPHFRAWISMPRAMNYDSRASSGVDLSPECVPPLYCAASCGFSRVVKHLIVTHGEDVNTKSGPRDEMSPLCAASRNGLVDSARVLLDHGAHVDAQDIENWVPFHFACYEGHMSVVQLLLEHGANLDLRTQLGETPLFLASESGHLEIVRLLLDRGANLSVRNRRNLTPFQIATENGYHDVAQLLLEHGAKRES